MGELNVNGIYGGDNKVFSRQFEPMADSAITIDFTNGVQQPSETTPIYTLMGCGFTQAKALKNPNQEFDDKGRLIKQKFGPYSVEYEYDENGIKTKEIRHDMPDEEGEDRVETTCFDETGKAVKRTWQYGVGREKSEEYTGEVNEEYDKETGLIKRTITRSKGKVDAVEYVNDKGQIVKTIIPDGTVLDKHYKVKHQKRVINYEYDEQGLLIKEISGPENDITIYKYNDKNKLVKRIDKWNIVPDEARKTYITNYEYNSKGQLIKVNHYDNGKFESGVRISYDESGNEAQRKFVFDDGKPYRIIKYKDGEILSDKEVW